MVREAVAALRADGLVVVRQGVGAFVAANVRRPFRIDVDGLRSLRQALDVIELRMGIDVEAAGLAAERGTATQIRKIAHAYEAVDLAIERGETAIDEDSPSMSALPRPREIRNSRNSWNISAVPSFPARPFT